jgi:hypothetical protein
MTEKVTYMSSFVINWMKFSILAVFLSKKYLHLGHIEKLIYNIFSEPPDPPEQGVDRKPGCNSNQFGTLSQYGLRL